MSLRVDRSWGQDPGWLLSLDPPTQIKLVAEYLVSNESPEHAKKQIKRAKRDKMKRIIERRESRGY